MSNSGIGFLTTSTLTKKKTPPSSSGSPKLDRHHISTIIGPANKPQRTVVWAKPLVAAVACPHHIVNNL
jgi:hypothetical protein